MRFSHSRGTPSAPFGTNGFEEPLHRLFSAHAVSRGPPYVDVDRINDHRRVCGKRSVTIGRYPSCKRSSCNRCGQHPKLFRRPLYGSRLARDRHVTGFPEFEQFCIAGSGGHSSLRLSPIVCRFRHARFQVSPKQRLTRSDLKVPLVHF